MIRPTPELNDALDDIFGAPSGDVRVEPIRAPADYQPREFSEGCQKCRGTGRFRSYSGRTLGDCFACKGAGKRTFKTSPEARAKARDGAADRKARRELEGVEAFRVANPAIWSWLLAASERGFGFAVSLMEGIHKFGGLTPGQMAAVERAIERDAEKAKAREERAQGAPVADTAGIDRLKAAFDTAAAKAAEKGRGIRNLRLTIGGIVISPAGANSKNPGALYVKSAGEYLGKIAAGRFHAVAACTPDQSARVLAFVADPKAAAEAYGQETGTCCICNAALTNKASIERGIGPICAEKFGW